MEQCGAAITTFPPLPPPSSSPIHTVLNTEGSEGSWNQGRGSLQTQLHPHVQKQIGQTEHSTQENNRNMTVFQDNMPSFCKTC